MNLQKIRYVREIARHKLNISAAAEALHTSQPGVSRPVRELESELAERVIAGKADVAIATETLGRYPELITQPLYRWCHCVVVPKGHPLAHENRLTLAKIARYPIVTYDAAFTGRTALDETFTNAKISVNIVLTAIDTDVIKTYVRQGLGIGIIASVAMDAERDNDLVALDGSKLFPERTTKLATRRGTYLRSYVKDFVASFPTILQSR